MVPRGFDVTQFVRWRSTSGVLAIATAIVLAVSFGVRQTPPPAGAANLDFIVKDMNGATVRLADFRGRPVILNFWATWCGPCRIEIPDFIALADQYKDRHLVVLGVSVDDQPEALRQFATEHRMNYPIIVGLGEDHLQEAYDAVMAIPVTWFIRADGTVQAVQKGPATHAWFQAQARALVASAAGDRP
jgi:cytochrome c biogenesis protein CcmG/thiol:disulfide interchange protein DsbE